MNARRSMFPAALVALILSGMANAGDKTIHPFGQADYPAAEDVEKDVVYAFGRLTGTLEAGGGGETGLPRTGQTTSYQDYDDGWYEAGLPTGAVARMTNNGDGTATDNATGLDWEIASSASQMSWSDAIIYAEAQTTGGHEDWRLPNINELITLRNSGTCWFFSPLTGAGDEWSSTTFGYATDRALCLDGTWFYIVDHDKMFSSRYVKCVRGGQLNP